MLVLFGVTLVHPPTMVERFARLQEQELSPRERALYAPCYPDLVRVLRRQRRDRRVHRGFRHARGMGAVQRRDRLPADGHPFRWRAPAPATPAAGCVMQGDFIAVSRLLATGRAPHHAVCSDGGREVSWRREFARQVGGIAAALHAPRSALADSLRASARLRGSAARGAACRARRRASARDAAGADRDPAPRLRRHPRGRRAGHARRAPHCARGCRISAEARAAPSSISTPREAAASPSASRSPCTSSKRRRACWKRTGAPRSATLR